MLPAKYREIRYVDSREVLISLFFSAEVMFLLRAVLISKQGRIAWR